MCICFLVHWINTRKSILYVYLVRNSYNKMTRKEEEFWITESSKKKWKLDLFRVVAVFHIVKIQEWPSQSIGLTEKELLKNFKIWIVLTQGGTFWPTHPLCSRHSKNYAQIEQKYCWFKNTLLLWKNTERWMIERNVPTHLPVPVQPQMICVRSVVRYHYCTLTRIHIKKKTKCLIRITLKVTIMGLIKKINFPTLNDFIDNLLFL